MKSNVNNLELKRFFIVFMLSSVMVYMGWLINYLLHILDKTEFGIIIYPIQTLFFIVGGATIAMTKWERAEGYMVFSFVVIGILYFALNKSIADYRSFAVSDYGSLATMSFALVVGLVVSIVSGRLARKISD